MGQSVNKTEFEKFTFLYNAIQDTQETIRLTDTKSGGVVVLGTAVITAILALIKDFIAFFNCQPDISKYILLIGSIMFGSCIFVAIYLSMKSINPCNNPNEHIDIGKEVDLVV
jgi:hypothetical protein